MRAAYCAVLIAGTSSPAIADPETVNPTITVGGYLETYYQLDAQNPSNRITNFRGFDNRSRTFTLSNVALDGKGERGPLAVHIILQVGDAPSTYYAAEPDLPGASGANATNAALWKYVQTATLSAKAPHDLVVEAGVFPSPIGPEVIPIKDNWNWSRSNPFFGLPFYHTGVTVARSLGCGWTGKLHVYNGWNSVNDNNPWPSVAASAAYANGKVTAQVLYFGGIERSQGTAEGTPWRNLLDAYILTPLVGKLSVGAHGDAGFERNHFGTDWWATGALYAKLDITPAVYAAIRGDAFYERVPAGATPIFFPATWVAEGTATLAYLPYETISVRLEYRHDQAASDLYFGGNVVTDPVTGAFVPDREAQDTVLLGATAWF